MSIFTSIINRIYSDYLMPSRLKEYESIIKQLSESGYEHLSIRDYCRMQKNGNFEGKKDKKYFINRHDIDTDIKTAKEFFKIEKKYNAKASYYFRLSTLDYTFMKEIEQFGSEASYHFEEIAQYCKDNHIKSKAHVCQNMKEIQDIFSQNFKMIQKGMGNYKIETICSHGDFVNRKLEITNRELTQNVKLREDLEISCETYDQDLMNSFDIYISDKPYPKFYSPSSIEDAINKKNIICMLTHPRQWRTSIFINTYDNIKRLYEGIAW